MRLATVAAVVLSIAFTSASGAGEKGTVKVGSFDVSKGFSSIVEKLLPAVVSIQATQIVDPKQDGEGTIVIPGMPPMNPGMRTPGGHGNPLEELFRDFFGQMERPRKTQAVGSGFIVYCDRKKVAYVITNHHVVNDSKTITVSMEDKTEIPAKLLASDARNDVAVLRLDLTAIPEEKRNLPVVEWADSDEAKAGDWVIAIGNPFNFGGSVTVGVVSYKGRYVPLGTQQDFEYIQHSAQINSGSSGGALFDINGRVIGINNAIITNTGGNIGIGFAIPSNVARQTVDQLIKYGKTRRAHLGIRIQQMNKDMAESQGLKEPGIIVGSVIEKGPSDGKLEQGDIIVGFEGKKVTESHTLSRMVAGTEIGKEIILKVIRNDKPVEVKIKVEEMPNQSDEAKETAAAADQANTIKVAGLEIGEIPPAVKESLKENDKSTGGVIIVGVDQSKDAADLFRRGDIIEQANHKPLKSPKDFLAAIERAKKENRKNVLLLISREGKPAYLPLRIEEDKAEEPKREPKEQKATDKGSASTPAAAPDLALEKTPDSETNAKDEKKAIASESAKADSANETEEKSEKDEPKNATATEATKNEPTANKPITDEKNEVKPEEKSAKAESKEETPTIHDNDETVQDADETHPPKREETPVGSEKQRNKSRETTLSKLTDKVKSFLGMRG